MIHFAAHLKLTTLYANCTPIKANCLKGRFALKLKLVCILNSVGQEGGVGTSLTYGNLYLKKNE